jgi:hypothetical protein
MSDPGNGTHLMILMTREELLVNRWYFYNGYIIGEMFSGFFIVGERTGEKSIFKDKDKWITETQSRGFRPAIWTRWYTDNWVDGDWLLIWVIFGFIISIPLTVFFILALYRAIVQAHFRLTSFYTIFVLLVVIVIGTTLLLDQYPGSI